MSRMGADGLLLITAFLWGVTFVAQKYATATMPPLAFVAARFAVSAGRLRRLRSGNSAASRMPRAATNGGSRS